MSDPERLEPSHLPDDELLHRSSTGDTIAFEIFVGRHERWLLRYATALAGGDGEELMQDAFVSAWRGAGTFAGGASARGWLATIARHALHRRFRRRSGEPLSYVPLDDIGAAAVAAGWGAESPDAVFERKTTRESLAHALAHLPADEREILTLRDLDGFSGEETAAILGVTLAAAKSRLHRARLHLAVNLRETSHG